jgi:hypothetical protein
MISVNIELEEGIKTYEFPTSWEDVTVEQFTKLFEENRVTDNELLNSVKVMSILSGIDEKIIMSMDVDDFKNLASELTFISEEITNTDVEYIEVDGEKFYLYKDFNKMTTGEIITIELLMEKNDGNIYKVMPQLLCIFLRKKNNEGKFEKFNTDMMERADKFKKVNISKIHQIFNFFLIGNTISNPNTLDFIQKENQ